MTTLHQLSDKWVLWAHLPHDINWNLQSYKKIIGFNALEDIIALNQHISDCIIKNCMLFLMKNNITPLWEDIENKQGGCFSFKVNNKNVVSSWKRLVYCLIGNTITSNDELNKNITGITISPKKSFCIIKVWLTNTTFQNPRLLSDIIGLQFDGCIFKKHMN
tara:strand:+ start:2470 stop:2955 length:486 start_codon:yes stop_codon:yes gene_type:complete